MGVSSTLLSSRRVFLGYLDFVSRQVISFIDDMFIKEVSEMIADWKAQGFTDKQISNSVFKKKDKKDKPIVQIVKFVIEKHSHVIKTLYWMDEEGMMEEKKQQFLHSPYVTSGDRKIRHQLIENNEINIRTKNPEFLDWKWIDPSDLPKVVVNFKSVIYKKLAKELTSLNLN